MYAEEEDVIHPVLRWRGWNRDYSLPSPSSHNLWQKILLGSNIFALLIAKHSNSIATGYKYSYMKYKPYNLITATTSCIKGYRVITIPDFNIITEMTNGALHESMK